MGVKGLNSDNIRRLRCQIKPSASVWNSLTYNTRSADLHSTSTRNLETILKLRTVNVNSRLSLLLCASDSPATYGAMS